MSSLWARGRDMGVRLPDLDDTGCLGSPGTDLGRTMRTRVVNQSAMLMSAFGSLFAVAYYATGFPWIIVACSLAFQLCVLSVPFLNLLLQDSPRLQSVLPAVLLWSALSLLLPYGGLLLGKEANFHLLQTLMASVAGLLIPSAPVAVLLGLINTAGYLLANEHFSEDQLCVVDWSQFSSSFATMHHTGNVLAVFVCLVSVGQLTVREHQIVNDLALGHVVALNVEARAEGDAKMSFLAMMSHELRTPLNAIIGLTEMLDASSLSTSIQHSSHALLTIINDVLDFSKLREGKVLLKEEELDPAALVEETAAVLFALAERKRLELVTDVQTPPGLRVLGDDYRLQQVLTNLVGNAIKFTDEGSITVALRLTERGSLSFTVTDTGHGIPDEALPLIFNPFLQVENGLRRRHEGTGLGLAICRRLVETMGGQLTVTSQLGEFARFEADVPLAVAACPEHAPRPPGSAGSVRLEDPSPLHAAHVRRLLAREGVDCDPAAGARPCRVVSRAGDAQGELTKPVTRDAVRRLADWLRAGAATWPPPPPQAPVQAESEALHLPEGFEVLLVEDNLVNQRVTGRQLSLLGVPYRVAADGSEAVRLFEERPPAMVLMDCNMPVMDGYAATRHIRGLPGGDALPIVALTADAFATANILEAGMDGQLLKPLRLTQLRRAIQARIP